MDILAYGEKNFTRNQGENDKKLMIELVRVGEREREKSLKTFEKGELNKSRSDFKKAYLRLIKNQFRLIKNQFRLIETDRSSQKKF